MKNKLNEEGIKQFLDYLKRLPSQPDAEIPYFLLESPETSSPTGFGVGFDVGKQFSSRHECGSYVAEVLANIEQRLFLYDIGFWSALALLWFDQLCPLDKKGKRKALDAPNFILSDNGRRYTRHSVRTAWLLVSLYGEDARFLQGKNMHQRGDLIESLLGTNYYIECKGVMLTASKLYTDDKTKSYKTGSSVNVREHYMRWLKQIGLTYDLFEISVDDLYEMLPAEFSRFKKSSN